MLKQLKSKLQKLKSSKQAKILARFFKTGKGEYGEGDKFLGIAVPELRKTAKKYSQIDLSDIQELLNSQIHEHRFTALVILINRYQKADQKDKVKIVHLYLKNIDRINNWDLVDLSAPKILGDWLLDKNRALLYQMTRSQSLWKRRIAIMTTLPFIKNCQLTDTLKIAKMLLSDKHDLIHKAVGWMLREVGKADQEQEEKFLQQHYKNMPRVMLRYAIEKFSQSKRKFYLNSLD